ncbi:MAG: hypothetical protein R3247_03635, partial [Rhodothermales bacterium]|nr:hypothetical protein [Rhodothermales bacterium]
MAPDARAQTAVEERYTFALVGVPLAEALERLLEETRLSLIYETALITDRTAYCRAERQPAEAVLACIL